MHYWLQVYKVCFFQIAGKWKLKVTSAKPTYCLHLLANTQRGGRVLAPVRFVTSSERRHNGILELSHYERLHSGHLHLTLSANIARRNELIRAQVICLLVQRI